MMKNDDITGKLVSAGISYVSIHPKSAKEIRIYLAKKLQRMQSEDLSCLEAALVRLAELQYIDDKTYAQAFIASRNRSKPKGKAMLFLELSRKGIDQDVISSVLSKNEHDDMQERDLAKKAYEKRQKALVHLSILEQKKKLFSFLLRRGFRSDIVASVVDGKV